MKRILAILCATGIGLTLGACKSHNEGNKDGEKKCEDCVAADLAGPTAYNPGKSCTSTSACQNNSRALLDDLANQWCHDNNADKCKGDCGGNHCDGIYDRARSNGLTVTAKVDPANPKHCAGTQVTCDAELAIPAGGLLACKCSCNPGR